VRNAVYPASNPNIYKEALQELEDLKLSTKAMDSFLVKRLLKTIKRSQNSTTLPTHEDYYRTFTNTLLDFLKSSFKAQVVFSDKDPQFGIKGFLLMTVTFPNEVGYEAIKQIKQDRYLLKDLKTVADNLDIYYDKTLGSDRKYRNSYNPMSDISHKRNLTYFLSKTD
nr:hypothetical protein [Pasteurella sp.]